MAKIRLYIDQVLQGTFELKPLNLLFVFQVNCPGCFMYGFPLVNQLYWRYQDSNLNILGLSTAFEDFEYNTAEHTQLLLTQQKTVGATRQAIGNHYPQAIDFPIAVDRLVTGADLDSPDNVDFLMQAIARFNELSLHQQTDLRQNLHRHLQTIEKASATFLLNHLPGTPTFLLFNQQLDLLESWFGHQPEATVIALLDQYAQGDRQLEGLTL